MNGNISRAIKRKLPRTNQPTNQTSRPNPSSSPLFLYFYRLQRMVFSVHSSLFSLCLPNASLFCFKGEQIINPFPYSLFFFLFFLFSLQLLFLTLNLGFFCFVLVKFVQWMQYLEHLKVSICFLCFQLRLFIHLRSCFKRSQILNAIHSPPPPPFSFGAGLLQDLCLCKVCLFSLGSL